MVFALLVPPPGAGLTTVTESVPAVDTSPAGSVALSVPSPLSVVVNTVPPTEICEPEMKLLPATVIPSVDAPTANDDGMTDVIAGTGLVTLKSSVLLVPPPGAGLITVIDRFPALVKALAGIVPETVVADVNVTASGTPPMAI
jgi:hypothetical protein